ncbi:MAG: hypothetical protein PHY74_01745 [Candidatus Bathyarchaeota archaeon]|nr:hypothetical protein [Candidatus Bathyarchaeota archaeon]MDD4325025.1 hypothetical protein [Candidatus Bathyarchaeota archaeon]MDI9578978.1 hypothetical protein [Thermoproteota archaeon]MDT8781822.1 hypothetical protein [Candidatus Bathyarchaeota archaeon]NLD66978.1 hypothetical protein [Thermoproteota archaeon]
MKTVSDYVSRIEGTCGAENDIIVVFRNEKKEEAILNIMRKATLKNTIAGVIFELTYKNQPFRLYVSGKAIFCGFKTKKDLMDFLTELLL